MAPTRGPQATSVEEDSESASRQPHDQLILVLSVRFYQLTKTATNFKVARIRKWQLIILIDLDI